jgi:hypothetical protein
MAFVLFAFGINAIFFAVSSWMRLSLATWARFKPVVDQGGGAEKLKR